MGIFVVKVAKGNYVNGDSVLLHFPRKLYKLVFVIVDWGAGEDYYALFLGFVLTVLEGELYSILV